MSHASSPTPMNVLVIGQGGREHALAWKLAASARARHVFVAPGNAGTQTGHAGISNVALQRVEEVAAFCARETVGLVVIGPETPLAQGWADTLRAQGIRVFGPSQKAAQLESSKAFAKAFLRRHGIPTADYAVFDDPVLAQQHAAQHGAPIVVKADGLAGGKGVVVATSVEEAQDAVRTWMPRAGSRLVMEEMLHGEEVSFICLVHGADVRPLATSQDHKRLRTGDQGPNTGGMGAYSPAPIVTPALHDRIMAQVIEPTVRGLMADGIGYSGFLYAGLMIAPDGTPNVLEFNCRLGDPETQPLMLRLQSDLLSLLLAALDGQLKDAPIVWDERPALGVVLAAHDYPFQPRTGDVIQGLPTDHTLRDAQGTHGMVFHAGTTRRDADANSPVLTHGGRVLCVTALGDNMAQARARAYAAADTISFAGRQMRRDIGERALPRRVAHTS